MGTSGTEPKQAQSSLLGAEDGGFPFEVVWRGETCTFPSSHCVRCPLHFSQQTIQKSNRLLPSSSCRKGFIFFLPILQRIAVFPAMVQQSCLLPRGTTLSPAMGLEKHRLPARSMCWLSTVNL